MPAPGRGAALTVVPVVGLGEVGAGTDLAGMLTSVLDASGVGLRAGDCLVVSSKIVSKALGLTWSGSREDAVAAATVRVVAERQAEAGVTRVVEAVAGPVMAAAGVDASNAGPSDRLLLLPEDPDAEAGRLRDSLRASAGMPASAPLAVVLSDTAGRPWREGLTDLALGVAGLRPLEDLRGAVDHDGRPLAVTMRAVADEVAAAADLVKGKADGIPAAVVRGLDPAWFADAAGGGRSLVRPAPVTGSPSATRRRCARRSGRHRGRPRPERSAWRRFGPRRRSRRGSGASSPWPCSTSPRGRRTSGWTRRGASAEVTLAAGDGYDLGRIVARAEVAAHSEGLRARVTGRGASSVVVALRPV